MGFNTNTREQVMTDQIFVQHAVGPGRSIAIRLTEGMPVESTDGAVGEIADVIIEPVRRRVTHLVVQHAHRHEQARLIPIDAVASFADMSSRGPRTVEHAPARLRRQLRRSGRWQLLKRDGASAPAPSSRGLTTAPADWVWEWASRRAVQGGTR